MLTFTVMPSWGWHLWKWKCYWSKVIDQRKYPQPRCYGTLLYGMFYFLSTPFWFKWYVCSKHSLSSKMDYYMRLTCNWLWEEPTGLHSGFKTLFFCRLFFSDCGLSSSLLSVCVSYWPESQHRFDRVCCATWVIIKACPVLLTASGEKARKVAPVQIDSLQIIYQWSEGGLTGIGDGFLPCSPSDYLLLKH